MGETSRVALFLFIKTSTSEKETRVKLTTGADSGDFAFALKKMKKTKKMMLKTATGKILVLAPNFALVLVPKLNFALDCVAWILLLPILRLVPFLWPVLLLWSVRSLRFSLAFWQFLVPPLASAVRVDTVSVVAHFASTGTIMMMRTTMMRTMMMKIKRTTIKRTTIKRMKIIMAMTMIRMTMPAQRRASPRH